MARITTVPLFLNKSLSAGDSGTSDPIDLRYNTNRGAFSLAHSIKAGTSTTCGTTIFSYVCCTTKNGTYMSPNPSASSAGTIGTSGPIIAGKITPFSPPIAPFGKVIATQTGTGTAGANSVITAELIVQ